MTPKFKRYLGVVAGIGIVLFAFHNINQPLIEYLFLPRIGMMMFGVSVAMYVMLNFRQLKFGPKKIWIPLVIIALSIIATSLYYADWSNIAEAFSGVVFALMLFMLYLLARDVGSDMFTPFTYAVIIGGVSVVIIGSLPGYFDLGRPQGGIISITNWDIATGLLVFGVVISGIQKRWWLSAIALVGLYFSGSAEGIFATGILAVMILVRRDFSKKMLLPIGIIILTISISAGLGHFQRLYQYSWWAITNDSEKINPDTYAYLITENKPAPIEGRVDVIKEANKEFSIIGNGYTIDRFNSGTVHNVPLVIVQQVGPIAAVCWVWVTLFLFVKSKWKYAFGAVIALSVFDHYIWTQVAPWWWALVGVASRDSHVKDYIFKLEAAK